MNRRILKVCATIACTLAIGLINQSTAQAKVKYVLATDSNGVQYRYDYAKLKSAYAMGKPLYTDFSSKAVTAYYDDVNNFYVAVKEVKLAYVNTTSGSFSMDDYVSSSKAKNANIGGGIKDVTTDANGQVVVADLNTVKHTTTVKSSIEIGKKTMITVILTDSADDGKYDILYNGTKLTKLDNGVYAIDVVEDVTQSAADAKITFVSIGDSQDDSFDVESIQ